MTTAIAVLPGGPRPLDVGSRFGLAWRKHNREPRFKEPGPPIQAVACPCLL